MKLSGSFLSTPFILVLFLLVVSSSAFGDPNWAPELNLPGDTSVRLCVADSLCYDIAVTDVDKTDSITLTLLEGPIDYATQVFGPEFTEPICFYPDTTGLYRFVWQIEDLQGHIIVDTVIYSVSVNVLPVIEDQYFSEEVCFVPQPRVLSIRAYDPDCDTLRFNIIEGPGTIDLYTGILEYTADTGGVYSWLIEVLDDCVADTAQVFDTIYLNQPPVFSGDDFTVNLCEPEEICFDVSATDPEGQQVLIFHNEGPGHTTDNGDNTATTCFTPINADSATYMFVYCMVDDCPSGSGIQQTSENPTYCVKDTVYVTVIIDQPPVITCPGPQEFFMCEPTTFCFDVPAYDPEGGPLHYLIISGNARQDSSSICFDATESGEFDIRIAVSDDCGKVDTCTVPVTVTANQPPYITMAEDYALNLCEPQTICFAAVADDPEFDIASVEVNYGYFDDASDRICFTPDTSGVYQIVMTATDGCGVTVSDTTNVTIKINDGPVVTLADDFEAAVCEGESICFDASAYDDNPSMLIITPGFEFDSVNSQICFTPDSSGVYDIWMRLTDDCDQVAVDTIHVTVDINSAPEVAVAMPDTSLYMCNPAQVCLPLQFSDLDGDIVEITANRGQYDAQSGTLCFVPYSGGEHTIIVSATDGCGHTVADTAVVTVTNDEQVALECPGEQTIFLCEPDTLCFPVGGIPEGATVEVAGTGAWWDEESQTVCFYSDCCIQNVLTVSATTDCGTYSCNFTVNVQTNSAPLVIIPQDTSFFFCEPTELRFPLGASDPDGNLMDVVVEGATFDDYRDEFYFTPDTSGTYIITATATDSCGATDVDQIAVTVKINQPPYLSIDLPDSIFRQCELSEIRIPIGLGDPDGQGSQYSTSFGSIEFVSGEGYYLVFTPQSYGDLCIDLTNTDPCGVTADLQVCVTIEEGGYVSIDCPIVEPAELCETGDLFVPFVVNGDSYEITTSFGEIVDGGLRFFADSTGRYRIEVIATSDCNADTCEFDINVVIAEPVMLTCPNDTTVFLCGPADVPVDFELTGTSDNFVIEGPAHIDTELQKLVVEVTAEGDHTVTLIASGQCYADTCSFTVTANFNEAPTITATDTSMIVCEVGPVCLPFEALDADGNLSSVVSDAGEIVDGQLCFTPPDYGEYEIILTATDSCGLTAQDTTNITITKGEFVELTCPVVEPVELCGPGEVCFPVSATGSNFQLYSDIGTIVEGQLCFDADTSGTYTITIIGDAGCNSDTCVVDIPVTVVQPVTLACDVNDTTAFFCDAPGHLMFPVEYAGDNVELAISPAEAWYEAGYVHIDADTTGYYSFQVIASNQCNADTCEFNATVEFNSPPILNASFDTTIIACDLETICLPLEVTDADDNLVELRATLGVVNDTIVCFTPEHYGDYEIIVTAVDECQETVIDTISLTIVEGTRAAIECPTMPVRLNLTTPTEARIPIGITPIDANVTVEPFGEYDPNTGEIVATFETTGNYTFTVIAEADCNTDTCSFDVEIGQYFSPFISCEGSVDTALCFTDPTTICLPFSASGTDVQVMVRPVGQIVGNTVCIDVNEPGEYNIDLIAYNEIEADTCSTILVVRGGEPAEVMLPADKSVAICEPSQICLPTYVNATDFGIANIDAGFADYNPVSKDLCFYADTAGVYELVLVVVDSCGNLSADTANVTVSMNEAPTIALGDDYSMLACGPEQVCVDYTVSDLNLADLTSNMGEINTETGQVCFTTEGSGLYELVVTATDSCGLSAADTIAITVDENSGPTITPMADTTVYLCTPTYICLDAMFDDVDGNIASVTTSRGQYSDGQICFVPYNMGTYPIILTVTDSCGLSAVDTAYVTVETDQAVDLQVPNDTSFFLCEADTVCFPVSNIPNGATVSVAGTGTWWDEATQSVCFYSDCCIENIITVSATTACGTYSENFKVTIETNSKPLVIVPADSTLLLCEPEPICFPVAVSDPDGNLLSVSIDGADFDDYRDKACLIPDGSGSYTITVTATDSCGAVDVDQITFDVTINEAPSVAFDVDELIFQQCEFTQLCLPVNIYDADGNLANVVTNYGEYDAGSGQFCFTPDHYGEYCLAITAVDSCGASSVDTICIDIQEGDYAAIDCPTPFSTDTLCAPEEICLFLGVTGDNFEVTTNYGSWVDGRLCFYADTSGTYTIEVIAEAQCVTDTCTIVYPVKILDPVTISCPGDTTEFLCGRDTLRYAFTASESVSSITVSSPAFIEGNEIVVPILLEGTLPIRLIASGKCGKDTCQFDITTVFNDGPLFAEVKDTALVECSLTEVCIPLEISDPNDNIASITTNYGTINEAGDKLCFTPPDYGVYEIEIVVTDECGIDVTRNFTFTYTEGAYASIICPDDDQFASLCGPDTVCIVAPITPVDAKITILPNGRYNAATGEICVWVTEGGSLPIKIIAESQCASDTCEFNLEVEMGTIPVVTSPTRIDTMLCLAEPTTLCFDIDVAGTGVQVNVNPVGTYSAGTICVPVEEEGTIELEIIAYGTCGADTSYTNLNISADEAPVLTLPENMTVERCPDDTNKICLDGIFATDAESDVTITQVCGPGTFNLAEPDSGGICWLPEAFGLSEFCFEATDGCHTVQGSFTIDVVTKSDCEVCVRAEIDGGASIPVGLRKTIAVNIETNDAIGGFDLLLSYDASALTFVGATKADTDIEEWEYFTYSLNNGACGAACPSGIVRLIGIADINNGTNHPPSTSFNPQGALVYVQFQVANDQNLESQFIPIEFVWFDCGDNTFSDVAGSVLYMDLRIFNYENVTIWDEEDDALFPENNRPFGLGAPDECLAGTEKGQPLRCVEFINGGIKITPVDSIDDRGDINLDGLAYTIADAVLFTNYFIDGLVVFTFNIPGQVAATDINADGITLSVADLVYLIRVVVGDADPIPKLVPYSDNLIVSGRAGDGILTVTTDAVADIGAGHLVYNIPDGVNISDVRLTDQSEQMDISYSVEGNKLRLLVFNIGSSSIPSGLNDLVEIEYTGEGTPQPVHLEFADYYGRPYDAMAKQLSLPDEYSLGQNYPNPFNPTTNISFNLANAGVWELQVFNVKGELIRRYEGQSAAGHVDLVFDGRTTDGREVGSGVYLYRLITADYSDSKKMILLK